MIRPGLFEILSTRERGRVRVCGVKGEMTWSGDGVQLLREEEVGGVSKGQSLPLRTALHKMNLSLKVLYNHNLTN